MNKDEKKMIEEIYETLSRVSQTARTFEEVSHRLYTENCRIIADDEIVVKKEDVDYITELYREKIGQVEKWRNLCELNIKETKQEAVREILQEVYDTFAKKVVNGLPNLLYDDFKSQVVKIIANRHGIELEKDNGQRRNI